MNAFLLSPEPTFYATDRLMFPATDGKYFATYWAQAEELPSADSSDTEPPSPQPDQQSPHSLPTSAVSQAAAPAVEQRQRNIHSYRSSLPPESIPSSFAPQTFDVSRCTHVLAAMAQHSPAQVFRHSSMASLARDQQRQRIVDSCVASRADQTNSGPRVTPPPQEHQHRPSQQQPQQQQQQQHSDDTPTPSARSRPLPGLSAKAGPPTTQQHWHVRPTAPTGTISALLATTTMPLVRQTVTAPQYKARPTVPSLCVQTPLGLSAKAGTPCKRPADAQPHDAARPLKEATRTATSGHTPHQDQDHGDQQQLQQDKQHQKVQQQQPQQQQRDAGWRGAGVIALAPRNGEVHVCIVEKLNGRLSFPKGGKKSRDGSAVANARREWEEETNYDASHLWIDPDPIIDSQWQCHFFVARCTLRDNAPKSWSISDDPADDDPIVAAHWMPVRTAGNLLSRLNKALLSQAMTTDTAAAAAADK